MCQTKHVVISKTAHQTQACLTCCYFKLKDDSQKHTQSTPAVLDLHGVETFSPNLDCTITCVAFSAKNLVNLSKSFLSCTLKFCAILLTETHNYTTRFFFSNRNEAFQYFACNEQADINIRTIANQKPTQRHKCKQRETCVTSRIYNEGHGGARFGKGHVVYQGIYLLCEFAEQW